MPKEKCLSVETLKQANDVFQETMTPENRVVRDDTITPFFIGLKLAGLQTAKTVGGTDNLATCDDCQGAYSVLVVDHQETFRACPFCNTKTPVAPSMDKLPVRAVSIQCTAHPEWGTFGVMEDHGDWYDIHGRAGGRVLFKSEAVACWEIAN